MTLYQLLLLALVVSAVHCQTDDDEYVYMLLLYLYISEVFIKTPTANPVALEYNVEHLIDDKWIKRAAVSFSLVPRKLQGVIQGMDRHCVCDDRTSSGCEEYSDEAASTDHDGGDVARGIHKYVENECRSCSSLISVTTSVSVIQ